MGSRSPAAVFRVVEESPFLRAHHRAYKTGDRQNRSPNSVIIVLRFAADVRADQTLILGPHWNASLIGRGHEMRSVIAFALLIVLSSGSLALTQSHETLAFTNATVIDTAGAPARPGSTVLVVGDRIAAVGPTRQVPPPEGARVVDATGKYVIPGLWDMHVHALSKDRLDSYFALFLANGVTGVRDMGSPMPLSEIAQLRRQIDVGKVLAPRIGRATGQILEGAQAKGWGELPIFKVIRTPEDGKRAVTGLENG
jgi:hypothetical protein